jgi:hypothetical protein
LLRFKADDVVQYNPFLIFCEKVNLDWGKWIASSHVITCRGFGTLQSKNTSSPIKVKRPRSRDYPVILTVGNPDCVGYWKIINWPETCWYVYFAYRLLKLSECYSCFVNYSWSFKVIETKFNLFRYCKTRIAFHLLLTLASTNNFYIFT